MGNFIWENRIWTDELEIHPSYWDENRFVLHGIRLTTKQPQMMHLLRRPDRYSTGIGGDASIIWYSTNRRRRHRYPILKELDMRSMFDYQQQSCERKCRWKRCSSWRWSYPLGTQGIGGAVDIWYSINRWRRGRYLILNNLARGSSRSADQTHSIHKELVMQSICWRRDQFDTRRIVEDAINLILKESLETWSIVKKLYSTNGDVINSRGIVLNRWRSDW